jgi:hypothetical protein
MMEAGRRGMAGGHGSFESSAYRVLAVFSRECR